MPNTLAIAISQSTNTFREFRLYLVAKGYTKEQVKQVEEASIDIYIPRCIKYIESLNIDFNEVINHYKYERYSDTYWDLIIISIVGAFRKIEVGDYEFNLF